MQDLLALLLPRICLLCGDGAEEPYNLCTGCIRALPRIEAFCRRCALPLSTADSEVCVQCVSAPLPFRHAVAAFRYVDPLDTLIQRLKYQRDLSVASTLGRLLAERIADSGDTEGPECILPVPLHTRRLRVRGFNQSLEVARTLASGTGIPVKPLWVGRARDTPVQSRARSVRARHLNVRGAFTASRRLARFRRVAIVDDVVTTGATAAELARCILARGVESVDLWCVARAERSADDAYRSGLLSRHATTHCVENGPGWLPRARWTR